MPSLRVPAMPMQFITVLYLFTAMKGGAGAQTRRENSSRHCAEVVFVNKAWPPTLEQHLRQVPFMK